jgi:HSP20 family protein
MTYIKWYNHPHRNQAWHGNHDYFNGRMRKPSANVMENDDAFKIELAVPGFQKKDFRINIEKDVLTISTEREMNGEENYTMREFGHNNISRSFSLPETVDNEKIKAEYKNGILNVTLPKREEVKIKKEIQVM